MVQKSQNKVNVICERPLWFCYIPLSGNTWEGQTLEYDFHSARVEEHFLCSGFMGFSCSVLLCIQKKILNQISLALRQIIFLVCIKPEIEDEYESGSGNVIFGFV